MGIPLPWSDECLTACSRWAVERLEQSYSMMGISFLIIDFPEACHPVLNAEERQQAVTSGAVAKSTLPSLRQRLLCSTLQLFCALPAMRTLEEIMLDSFLAAQAASLSRHPSWNGHDTSLPFVLGRRSLPRLSSVQSTAYSHERYVSDGNSARISFHYRTDF